MKMGKWIKELPKIKVSEYDQSIRGFLKPLNENKFGLKAGISSDDCLKLEQLILK